VTSASELRRDLIDAVTLILAAQTAFDRHRPLFDQHADFHTVDCTRVIHHAFRVLNGAARFFKNSLRQNTHANPPAALERMREIGQWLDVNGEAIYGTRPIAPYKEGDVVFTTKGKSVFAILVQRNEGDALPAKITLKTLKPGGEVTVLGSGDKVKSSNVADGVQIALPLAVREMPQARYGIALRWEKGQ